ncbi:MAG: aminopeptidase P family N-terminal domain-containing protein [Firmicutes bacterium]|nr:aminopeptidase P family N-terminal domain-containing protein [Bacillota bacterium]
MSGTKRTDRLRPMLDQAHLDALIVKSAPNRRYLSGFTGSAGILVISRSRPPLMIVDSRYEQQARQEAPDWEIVGSVPTYEAALFDTLQQ